MLAEAVHVMPLKLRVAKNGLKSRFLAILSTQRMRRDKRRLKLWRCHREETN